MKKQTFTDKQVQTMSQQLHLSGRSQPDTHRNTHKPDKQDTDTVLQTGTKTDRKNNTEEEVREDTFSHHRDR